jgi:Fe-S cluster biogenesis protein NfuA
VAAEDDDTAGPPILFDDVQALLDDMVRPALQGDGGDITLIKVEQRKIFVRLVGACSTCPSSIMTMKMGVEALLKEEFPQMEELVQVEA